MILTSAIFLSPWFYIFYFFCIQIPLFHTCMTALESIYSLNLFYSFFRCISHTFLYLFRLWQLRERFTLLSAGNLIHVFSCHIFHHSTFFGIIICLKNLLRLCHITIDFPISGIAAFLSLIPDKSFHILQRIAEKYAHFMGIMLHPTGRQGNARP